MGKVTEPELETVWFHGGVEELVSVWGLIGVCSIVEGSVGLKRH